MEASSLILELSKAVPVIAGGLLAILGGIIAQVATHHFSASREKTALLRSRIELIAKALYAHSQWLEERVNQMIFKNEDHESPSPLPEAQMLVNLYFPELQAEIAAVMQAQVPMIEFIGNQRLARMADLEAWIKSWDREVYNAMYKAQLEALNRAINKCREILQSQLHG
jgi:hypothetical protein